MKRGTAIALGLGAAGAAYLYMKPKSASATASSESDAPVEVTEEASEQPTISKRKGDLKVVLTLRVSGMEKMFAKPADILRDVLNGARALANALPSACPGAPKIIGAPTGTIASVNDGYAIHISFPALWGHTKTGPIQTIVLNCIIKEIRKQPKINERFVKLTAQRINTYA